ncbi:hypothetical protein B7C51_00155 [Paenibacillus larvae subsp. pulvifaciens]|uniref:Uncharacterized protein n=1 Tax=Paenibacillus larvae subsp. pulvifaciens TaxID=1477 RepID=A0A1V0UMQ0_9BACL|nr:hypothetical protein [Paenibacillus larvae]ARF66543.1 hypothetical protein B7C51_00155 [Paenibacillus larvae subsp. pulvifaciens]
MSKLREINGEVYRELDRKDVQNIKVGDYILYEEDHSRYLTLNKPYEVVEVGYDTDSGLYVDILDDDGDEYDVVGDEYVVLEKIGAADDPDVIKFMISSRKEQIAELEEKLEEASRLGVGDYAKIIEVDPCDSSYGVAVGDIVQVTHTDDTNLPYRCVGPKYSRWFYARQLERATDEVVAAAKQEEKWAKIGRKVNEFKVGDIVKYKSKVFGEIEGFDYLGVNQIVSVNIKISQISLDSIIHAGLENITLVTPVESRFDQ